MESPLLRTLKLKVFEEELYTDLEDAVNAWLLTLGEERLVWIRMEDTSQTVADQEHMAFILYSEG